MTSYQVLYEELVKVNIPDDIIKIIFEYTKCDCEDCYEFGNKELITYEDFSSYNGYYCFSHYDVVMDDIEYQMEQLNSYPDDEYDEYSYDDYDGGFMGWDFGASVDI